MNFGNKYSAKFFLEKTSLEPEGSIHVSGVTSPSSTVLSKFRDVSDCDTSDIDGEAGDGPLVTVDCIVDDVVTKVASGAGNRTIDTDHSVKHIDFPLRMARTKQTNRKGQDQNAHRHSQGVTRR